MLTDKSPLAIATLAGLLISACHNVSTASIAASEQDSPTAQSTGTDWSPKWNTSPDKSRRAKTRLVPTIRFADDGFRGSPVVENQEEKRNNTRSRTAFAQSLQGIPECSGIDLRTGSSDDTDFVLQLFNSIEGRSGRLQWVLYRTDTLGAVAYGEGTGADTKQGQDGITTSVCSSIHNATTPEAPKEETQPSVGEIEPSLKAWETAASSLEASFSHVRYSPPKGFSMLPDDIRRKENRNRYQTQLADAIKKEGPDRQERKTKDGKQVAVTHKTEAFPPYMLLVAARTAPTTSETDQLPRVVISAQKRITMLMDAGDPAKILMRFPQVKSLVGPEEVTLSGQKFVRADFQFSSGNLLSKFSTVMGDYLLEFDLRAEDAKELEELANSMQSVVFQP